MNGREFYVPDLERGWPWWAALAPSSIPNALVGQAWTMCYEVMFYLAFGAAMLVPPRVGVVAFAGWAVVALAALARPVPADPLAALVVSPFVLEFLGGCVVAWLTGRGERRGRRLALALGLGYAAVGVTVAATTAAVPYDVAMSGQALRVLVFGPAAVLIVYACVAAEGVWPRAVPAWLARLGDASYSLYLVHPPALLIGKWTGVLVPHTRLPHALWVGGTVLAVVAVGLLFHRWVERPLLGLANRRPAPPPAAVGPPVRRAA